MAVITYRIGMPLSDTAKKRFITEIITMGYVVKGSGSQPGESYILLDKALTPTDEASIKAKMWDILIWKS